MKFIQKVFHLQDKIPLPDLTREYHDNSNSTGVTFQLYTRLIHKWLHAIWHTT